MLGFEDIFSDKKSVLFIAAHPDDVDYYFGGLIARLCKEKTSCFFQIMTSGEMGGNGDSPAKMRQIREEEELVSLKSVGIPLENIEFIRKSDGGLEADLELIGLVVKAIRLRKPEIICTIDPRFLIIHHKVSDKFINHRDHRMVGTAVIDALYPYSRLKTFYPEYGRPYTVNEVLLADTNEVNTMIDYSNLVVDKKRMLLSHQSQWGSKIVEEILKGDKVSKSFVERFNYLKASW
ncbi:MAG: GlcNAc-PI de-N-acetylase family [candidate division CPR1 bacterium GW2011_GWA2_42_17]|uniref:GlcNAc-PI de-N-acetylase family n=1 Tax=candidate division CPR1 bacterium GW2011_GWA2_42_17 TaxID=1618341 RepID=A0A0G0Z5M5_9BACT|nr:MAG: GlcNAc-PI de-N-acetylase family [candidate division CPR1 bacterium GW2011_GWA2_42_17]